MVRFWPGFATCCVAWMFVTTPSQAAGGAPEPVADQELRQRLLDATELLREPINLSARRISRGDELALCVGKFLQALFERPTFGFERVRLLQHGLCE